MTKSKGLHSLALGLFVIALAASLWVGFSLPKAPQALTTAAQAGTIAWVDDDDPTCGGNQPCFKAIQAAVDALAKGTVYIRPGTYREHVVLTKDVKIEGAGRELVRLEAPDSNKPAILVKGIKSATPAIKGLSIFGGEVGIQIEDAEVYEICDNRIANNAETGIRLVRSSVSIAIYFNELPDFLPSYSLKRSSLQANIEILEGSSANINRNTVFSILFERSDGEIKYNTVNRIQAFNAWVTINYNRIVGEGILLARATRAKISFNEISGGGTGIWLLSGSMAQIENNIIFNNVVGIQSGDFGIEFEGPPTQFTIIRNRIMANSEWGLALYEGVGSYIIPSRARVWNNWISENGTIGGGVTFGPKARLDFSNNWVVNNKTGICPYFDRDNPIDPESITGSNNEIRDNYEDFCEDSDYPWPPGFRK